MSFGFEFDFFITNYLSDLVKKEKRDILSRFLTEILPFYPVGGVRPSIRRRLNTPLIQRKNNNNIFCSSTVLQSYTYNLKLTLPPPASLSASNDKLYGVDGSREAQME